MATTLHEHDLGITWVVDEPMARASHALAADGQVWLIDPVDQPDAIDRAGELGTIAGVVQLLDRHERDGEELAQRLGVPHHRLPTGMVPGSPFEAFAVVDVPKWREVGLWWEDRRALVVAEAVGTGPFFRTGDAVAGIHAFLRAKPPGAPREYTPDHLLVGHGAPVHGAEAAAALEDAYRRSRRDIPAMLKKFARALRPGG